VRFEKKIFVPFVAALLFGCSSEKESITADRTVTASDIMMMVNALPASVHTFSAVGSVNVETPQMSQSAGFDLAVKKPDSVRISVEGPFGITVGRALFTNHHFIAYNALNNTVYTGDPAKGMKSFPFFSGIEPDVLIDAISGVRRFNDPFSTPDSFSIVDETYRFRFANGTYVTTIVVDPRSMRIIHVQTYAHDASLMWEEYYTYVQGTDGVWQPATSKIIIPKRMTSIEFMFDEVAFNPALSSLSIAYPDDAEQIVIN
jgi:outer membrane lipoprotein-sorting protein